MNAWMDGRTDGRMIRSDQQTFRELIVSCCVLSRGKTLWIEWSRQSKGVLSCQSVQWT